jgi:hypothetical protein
MRVWKENYASYVIKIWLEVDAKAKFAAPQSENFPVVSAFHPEAKPISSVKLIRANAERCQ